AIQRSTEPNQRKCNANGWNRSTRPGGRASAIHMWPAGPGDAWFGQPDLPKSAIARSVEKRMKRGTRSTGDFPRPRPPRNEGRAEQTLAADGAGRRWLFDVCFQ